MDAEKVLAITAQHDTDLTERLRFLYEIDQLKNVLRQTPLADRSRPENSAEHSWHLAMTAMTLEPLAAEPVDLTRVIKILLVHDIVEIDAGDVFIFDEVARAEAEAKEVAAADRIFGLLPEPQSSEFRALWDEYEARETSEARFAYSCDRLQPFLLNVGSGGGSWIKHGITADRVRSINGPIGDALPTVWPVAWAVVEAAIEEGILERGPAEAVE